MLRHLSVSMPGSACIQNPAARATLEYGSTKCELVLPKEGGVVVCTP